MNELTKQPNHSTSCANFDLEILNFQNLICPFGLKHGVYTSPLVKDFILNEMGTDAVPGGGMGEVALINVTKTEYQYKYQGQERQDELGLNWDSFKWRNYDYAIGRFFNHDPLSEKYVYNSPYAFQENKMGMGVELEGLELKEHDWMSPKTKSYIQEAKASMNNVLSANLKVKPKLGLGMDFGGTLGPVKLKANVSALEGSSKIVVNSEETKTSVTGSVLKMGASAELKDAKLTGDFSLAEGTMSYGTKSGFDATGEFKKESTTNKIGSDMSFSLKEDAKIGVSVKLFKALSGGIEVNVGEFLNGVVNTAAAGTSMATDYINNKIKEFNDTIQDK
ncbi:MAG TPA: RHS repeat-associated core domain-containing protein [Moheibacter sp.]|nr:RHS repeat-associated core domain-containing protein [Moheibacter sp.]